MIAEPKAVLLHIAAVLAGVSTDEVHAAINNPDEAPDLNQVTACLA